MTQPEQQLLYLNLLQNGTGRQLKPYCLNYFSAIILNNYYNTYYVSIIVKKMLMSLVQITIL